ncbi:MAG: DUF697 domain-containing protein [Acidobacteria bacterium]|jgi:uncharacterized protein (DUF697 family)|nr:DUF697 domain-containing protein [Acidobacteriota bacterium]
MTEKKDLGVTHREETREKDEPEVPIVHASKKIKEDKDMSAINYNRSGKIVNRYVLWSMGAGLIPVPMLDITLLAGVQLKMLYELSVNYDIRFSENIGKSVIAVLTGTITADALRKSTITSFLKSIPIIGFLGSISMPIYSGAITYAIGKVFIQHFESGGTFLDFDPQKVKDYFAKLYKEGQKVASNFKAGISNI